MLLQTRYTPHLIVKNCLKFSIPLYQRLFAWGEDQVNGLMIDLKDHFLNDKTDLKPYYLGQMTVVSQAGLYALIDGQQRFTIMTLFAIALLQCEELKDKEQIDNWKNFLSSGDRINFKGRKEDNNYVSSLINNVEDPIYENPRMKVAINVMKEAMPKGNLDKFAQDVFNNLSFFFAELDVSYLRYPASLNKYF